MIKQMRSLLDKVREVKVFKPMDSIFNALDAAVFGSRETTHADTHCVDGMDIKRYMTIVIVGLLPAVVASVIAFGPRALAVILTSYAFGGIVEVAFAMVRKKDIHEGFLVTGLIFPLTLPPTVPLWVVAVGVVAGTLFGKEVFGGTGRNIFNPALVGRLFVTIAFPAIMTTAWQVPGSDAITAATPLAVFKTAEVGSAVRQAMLTGPELLALLFGTRAGSMGEVFRIGLIVGGIFVIATRVGEWRIPTMYLGSVAVLSALGHLAIPARIAPPQFQLLSGGLMLGAFFMATDPVTSPFTLPGKYIFGLMCGLLTVLIRAFSGYVEGVMFSIVIMNSLSPLIDHAVLKATYRLPRGPATVAGVEDHEGGCGRDECCGGVSCGSSEGKT